MKKFPPWLNILIGMVSGVLFGLLSVWFKWDLFTLNWIKPWGTIFLNLLKLIAVPLVFVSLVKGISSLKDISKFRRIGLKTIVLYVLTTVFAISVGLILVNIIKPGDVFPAAKKAELSEKFSSKIAEKQEEAGKIADESPLNFIVEIVPDNIIAAASDNSNMLKVIFFAILFAIAMILLPDSKTQTASAFFDNLNDIILKIIDMIMKTAPYGVFALMAALVVDFSGDKEVFIALGLYMITVITGLLFLILLFYPFLGRIISGMKYNRFIKAILPSQIVAFTTSSSAATLPVNLSQCINEFKVSRGIANFVLPVGVTINMDGTSLYQAVAAVFIAQVFGMDLTFGQQMIIILTALISSIGSPGIPGGSIVMLIIVLNSVHIPVEGMALILGVDRLLDMLRTVANVTGDVVVATIVAKSENGLTIDSENEENPLEDIS